MADEAIWRYLRELSLGLADVTKAVLALVDDEKELDRLKPIHDRLARLLQMFSDRELPDPRPKVKKVNRDDQGRVESVETVPYE